MEEKAQENLIQIFMNDKPFELAAGHYTGAELKQKTDVPAADVLYRIDGKNRHEITDSERVEIHKGEHFVAVPGHGGAG